MSGNFVNDFPQVIQRSMEVVRKILDQTKNPMVAADLDHRYEDKFALVEFLTNTGIAATLNVLEQLDGFNEGVLKQICAVVHEQKRSMTLRLAVEEDCEFLEETTRTVETPTSRQVTVETTNTADGSPASTSTISHKAAIQVKEYHWKAGVRHSLTLFAGTDPSMGITLGGRTGTTRLVTAMNRAPFPPTSRHPIDLDLTWLIDQIKRDTLEASFVIHREKAKTPRRNEQTEEALLFIDNLSLWSVQSLAYFCHRVPGELLRAQTETSPTDWLPKIEASKVFVPVVPLFQEYDTGHDGSDIGGTTEEKSGAVAIPAPKVGSRILPLKDSSSFLKEQCTSLTRTLLDLVGNFPDPADQGHVTSGYEAKLVLLWLHLRDMAAQWSSGINYVEEMLRAQLVSAVGKHVQEADFDDFLKFHNQRLFGKTFAPKPFCHAIRQPNQYPDGELSIVAKPSNNEMAIGHPIETFSRRIPGDSLVTPLSIPLNAATTIEFMGDQYLHGWMDTQFASQTPERFFISARARQFSCFLLVTGNISGPNEFQPNDAIIVQNKDNVLMELLATSLPSAKEFRDAIKSLSPEQARFAKSYRAMQLDSSVFGVWVVQVKPQMEALLGLPPASLTKEIRLSQDLLSLFVEYQIPPSLVSYDGDASAAAAEKVAMVKQHVKGVLDVIGGVKEDQLQQEERMKSEMQREMKGERSCLGFSPSAVRFGAAASAAPASGALFGAPASRPFGALALSAAPASSPFVASAPAPASAAKSFFSTPVPPPYPSAGAAAAPGSAPPAFPTDQQQGAETENVTLDLAEGFDIVQDHFSGLGMSDKCQHNDFTAIPKQLDQMFESFDKDGALRTMTIRTGDRTIRTRQENVLTKVKTLQLTGNAKKTETNKALDLLDVLSRSGSLPIVSGELHVIIGVRHSFEKNVMATVIEENVNPIEKVDYSSLLIAASVHEVKIPVLLANAAETPALVLKDQEFPPSMGGRIEGGDEQVEQVA